jgi:hypothetical protein
MRTNLETEVFLESKKRWGMERQIMMLAEESAELSVASHHICRDNKDHQKAMDNFAEEIADVEFMIAEMRYFFPELDAKIMEHRLAKARRIDLYLQTHPIKKSP